MRSWLGMVVLIGGAAVGCGEEIVPGVVVDQPLFTVSGHLVGDSQGAPVRAGVLWVDPFGERDDVPSPPNVSVSTTAPDGTFSLRFFRPPPDEVIRRIASSNDRTRTAFAFAFAEMVAFQDVDGNDTFRVRPRLLDSAIVDPDRYRGSGGERVLMYVEQQRLDSENVIPELDAVLTAPPGYYLVGIACRTGLTGQAGPSPDVLVPLPLDEQTSAFPETRTCLRAHATPAAP